MPKAQFSDFVKSSPFFKGLVGNHDAEKIFDILNEDEQIFEAVSASEDGLPALLPSVKKIEDFFSKNSDGSFPMTDTNKRIVGRMQKFVLEPFGYLPKKLQGSLSIARFSRLPRAMNMLKARRQCPFLMSSLF